MRAVYRIQRDKHTHVHQIHRIHTHTYTINTPHRITKSIVRSLKKKEKQKKPLYMRKNNTQQQHRKQQHKAVVQVEQCYSELTV